MDFQRLAFVGSDDTPDNVRAGIVGIPYDFTTSFRPGTRFGPDALRRASDSIETYDPTLDLNLEDLGAYFDFGSLGEMENVPDIAQKRIQSALHELPEKLPILGLGGEHSVTPPLFARALEQEPELAFIVLDAHADLREAYEGSEHSHACATRRVMEMVGPERIAMFGVRSGLQAEFQLMREQNLRFELNDEGIASALQKLGDRPLYLSVDLDGFDPSILPGTGTVEPGGLLWQDFQRLVIKLKKHTVHAGDVVELAPTLDSTGRSDVYAAHVARMILALMLNR